MDGMTMTVRVDGAGRIVLPAAVREHFHWTPGSTLSLRVTEAGISLMDREAAIAELRKLLAPVGQKGYTSERYLAEKRAEVDAEDEDEQRWLSRPR